MDEITRYIFNNCQEFLTNEENKAHKNLIVLQKIDSANIWNQKKLMRKKWISKDESVLKLLENGSEEFYKKAVERVFRDNPNKEFLNLCPKCSSLAKTPKAKQCPKCFYSWHNL